MTPLSARLSEAAVVDDFSSAATWATTPELPSVTAPMTSSHAGAA